MNNKVYEKALHLYNDGRIDKAIQMCEREISKDLSNPNVINLKGILLYLKGDLEDAVALWKINNDYNNDDISNSYLKDVQNDFNRMELHKEAEELIKNLYIDEAIDILDICSESDFNSINVNNSLATCYFRKGDFIKVKEYLDKVFKIDSNNEIAKILNDKLDSNYKCGGKKRKFLKGVLASIVIVIIISVVLIEKASIFENNLEKEELISENMEIENNKETIIINNDYKAEEKQTKSEVVESLSYEEIKENYLNATEYYEEGKYEEAKDILEQTINKSNNNHLDDDIIFLLASSYDSIGNIDGAIGNFDKYILNYAEGSYIQEVYYRAAFLYKDIDIIKSKKYANKILINYPDSIYNNSYIEEIIKS